MPLTTTTTLTASTGRAGDTAATITVSGEIDYATAPQLRAAITAVINNRPVTALVLDLHGVAFVDSTGLGTLVAARRICRDLAITMILDDVSPQATHVIRAAGLGQVFALAPSADPARV